MIAVNRLKMSGELNLENQFTDRFLFFRKMNECAERFDLIWFIRLLRLNCTPLQWVNRFRIDAVYVDGAPPKNWWGELWAYACTRTVRVHSLEQNTSHSNNEQLVPRGQLVRSCRLQTLGFCVCLRESGIQCVRWEATLLITSDQNQIRAQTEWVLLERVRPGHFSWPVLTWPARAGPLTCPVLPCPGLAGTGQDRTPGRNSRQCVQQDTQLLLAYCTAVLFCSLLYCSVQHCNTRAVLCCAVRVCLCSTVQCGVHDEYTLM